MEVECGQSCQTAAWLMLNLRHRVNAIDTAMAQLDEAEEETGGWLVARDSWLVTRDS